MNSKIPKINIQSVSQVEESLTKKSQENSTFNKRIYAELNDSPNLQDTLAPQDFYDAYDDEPSLRDSLFKTAFNETLSLEDESEPPYIDLDKDQLNVKFDLCKIDESIYHTARQMSSNLSSFLKSEQFESSQFTSPQGSSTNKSEIVSVTDEMSKCSFNDQIMLEEIIEDPLFSTTLSNLIQGNSDESKDNSRKYTIIELFDRLCRKEQDKYRSLMKTNSKNEGYEKVNLENLDYETSFIDLSAETRSFPSNLVSTAIDSLTRAEIKNEVYRTMTKNKTDQMKFNLVTEAKNTAFIPETRGNIEIISYLGSTGQNQANTGNYSNSSGHHSQRRQSSNGSYQFESSDFNQSSFEDNSNKNNPLFRWNNISNLAESASP